MSAVPAVVATPAALPGVNVLLEGPAGTGKTFAFGNLVDWCHANGLEVFILFTEQGAETLLGYWIDRGLPVPSNLHYHLQNTRPLGLAALIDSADKVGKLSYEAITKMVDPTRSANNAFKSILQTCADFPCDKCGKKFGAVDLWGPDKVFGLDSLTELANAAMKMVIGNKPTAAPPDYGVAQNNLMNFIRLCTQGSAAHFVMTAHVSREKDEITGGTKVMTRAIGGAISGDIPPLFSEAILTVREGDKFYWDTASLMADVKTRYLPINSRNLPDFALILNKWRERSKSFS